MKTVCALIFVSIFAYSSAISCYVCDSATDSKCGDPFLSLTSLKECGAGGFAIHDACWKFTASANGQTVVSRACGMSLGISGCKEHDMLGTSGSLCVCKGDNCNGASYASVTPFAFLMAALIAVYRLL